MAYGPSSLECALPNTDSRRYGPSVLARSKTNPPGDWDQRVRLYEDGLLRDQWTPSFSGYRATGGQPKGFRCPVKVIFGMQDVALDPRVVIDGIEKYFQENAAGEDQIVRLPGCGHWSVLEEEGVKALDGALMGLL